VHAERTAIKRAQSMSGGIWRSRSLLKRGLVFLFIVFDFRHCTAAVSENDQ